MSKVTRTLFTLFIALGAAFWLNACTKQFEATETAKEEPTAKEEVKKAPEPADTAKETASEETAAPSEGALAFETEDWDDWFQDKAIWVGSMKEFDLRTDTRNMTEGGSSLKANAKAGDGRIRDLYLARHFEGLTPGKTYKISLDYRFDIYKPDQNYIQYAVASGDHEDHDSIAVMEDYPDRPVPTTKYVDKATLGNEQFNKLEVTHTLAEGETDMTLMMIVRFQAKSRRKNYFYMDNLQLEEK
ncbi:hypothetical protein K8I31_13475 [bacterium]|nr:hypothetical protein [bacterium]